MFTGFKINKAIPFTAGIIFIALRFLGDLILYSIGAFNESNLTMWRVISTIAILCAATVYFFAKSAKTYSDDEDLPELFVDEVGKLGLVSLFIILAQAFIPSAQNGYLSIRNFISFFIAEATIIAALIFSIQAIYFLFKWLLIRRHKKTKFLVQTCAYILSWLIFSEAAKSYSGILNSLSSINNFLVVSLALFVFFASKKHTWISALPRNKKMKIFWLALVVGIMSISFAISTMSDSSRISAAMESYSPGAGSLFNAALFMLWAYLTRLFFAILTALPTTSIMERRASEISSLTYLNGFITESAGKDISNLLQTVTQLALNAGSATAAWTEIYEDSSILIGSNINIDENKIKNAHEKARLKAAFTKYTKPKLIESIPESHEFAFLKYFIDTANALIAIPLFQGDKRFGTLVVIDTEEFGFERDDIKVLGAFGDNVNIALENSRLLKDSIEKEKYKSELQLARVMQNKLLPQKLPYLNNYTVSAFSKPAEEVGGDYYDVVKLKDGRFCFIIADVSGKGMSAAFYMAQLKGVAHSVAPWAESPADLLKRINAAIYGILEKQSYITMSALSVDDDNGGISFSRAGHMPILIKTGGEVRSFVPKGLGVGLVANSIFNKNIEQVSFRLEKGDVCLLFTDGLNELRNSTDDEFGYDKLKNLVEMDSDNNAQNITNSIITATDLFMGEAHQHDDMTVLAITFFKFTEIPKILLNLE